MKKSLLIALLFLSSCAVSKEELTSTCQAQGKLLGTKEMDECIIRLSKQLIVDTVPPAIYEQSNKQAEAVCVLYGFKKNTENFNYCKELAFKQEIDNFRNKRNNARQQALDNYVKLNQQQYYSPTRVSGFTCHHMGAFTTCN